ncbi:TPA: fimbria/pilus periplasmic chaperone [Pseudomonas putida]|nr:fimbria/pilus periplasmic chaperone [Pseudomonas putida]
MVKMTSPSLWLAGCLSATLLWSGLAQAEIVIQGSRVVYPSSEREVTVKMTNKGSEPSLIQAWIDKGNPKLTPDNADGPFLITPPITRVEPGKGQALRLVYTGDEAAAKKQESVFWLNVLDVPPMPKNQDANYLQVAVRSRLKIFYRPEGLPGSQTEAAAGLKWSVANTAQGYALRARNDAAFHVSLATVTVTANGKAYPVKSDDMKMVAPGESVDFPLQDLKAAPGAGSVVEYQWVNDWGAANKLQARL